MSPDGAAPEAANTQSLGSRLVSIAVRPGDSPLVRLRKRGVVVCMLASASLLILTGVASILLGLPELGKTDLVAALASLGVLAAVAITGRGALVALWGALICTQAVTAWDVWEFGGFMAAAGAPVWGALAPVGALLFLGWRQALLFGTTFVVLLLAATLFEGTPASQVSSAHVTLMAVNVAAVSSMMVGVLAWFVRDRERMMALVDRERARNERLLLDVLPEEVASALKAGSASIAHHESVTVLFADLVGFTPLSARTSPEQTVGLLSEVFAEVDALAERLGLEKIKTIGDCYMVASGVPTARPDHAEVVVRFGLALRELMRSRTFRGHPLAFRVGIHSGPVIAGVIGRKRFLYDLWGDTVNTAARMEQHGAPNEVQVSDATAALVREAFELEDRGEQPVKGKGTMRLWFVRGERASHKGAPEGVALR